MLKSKSTWVIEANLGFTLHMLAFLGNLQKRLRNLQFILILKASKMEGTLVVVIVGVIPWVS